MEDSGGQMPETWLPQKENLLVVPLKPSDQEYNQVLANFSNTLGGNHAKVLSVSIRKKKKRINFFFLSFQVSVLFSFSPFGA
jgi:hypothetical protein